MKRICKLLALTALSVLACVVMAYASEHGAEHHGIPWGNFIARVVNFALFVGIIWFVAGKKIAAFFADRRSQISTELDDSEARQAQAEEKLKEVEQGIANLEEQKNAILAEAKQQGEALKAAIIAKAEKDAAALQEQAKRTAENEAKAALDSIRAEMAELLVDSATKIVQEKLTPQDHDKLVDEYLTKVVFN